MSDVPPRAALAFLCAALLAWGCQDPATPGPSDQGVAEMSMADADQGVDLGAGDMRGDMRVDMRADMQADMGSLIPDPSIYASCAPYAPRGPHPVGVVTLMVDGSPVEVWYPAVASAQTGSREVYDLRDWLPEDFKAKIPLEEPTRYTTQAVRGLAPDRAQRWPVALFSHGFAGYRLQSSELTTHLASWGFVVASGEHPERNLGAVLSGQLGDVMGLGSVEVLRRIHEALGQEAQRAGSPLEGLLDLERVGVLGHSAGGRTAIYTAPLEFVGAVVGLAPAVGGLVGGSDPSQVQPLVKPTMVVVGSRDSITSEGPIRAYYDAQGADARGFVSVEGAGHLAFSDICVIGRERGGVAQIAVSNGVMVPTLLRALSQDGCRSRDLRPELAWPMIHHVTVAHLRASLGVDPAPVGLGEEAAACFGELTRVWAVPASP